MLYIFINLTVLAIVLLSLGLIIQGAIYVPSTFKSIRTIIRLANVKKGDRMADLGSGDGRLVIAFAKKGAIATGYEINPFLVMIARKNIRNNHLENRANILWQNYWNRNLSQYRVITVFGIGYIMGRLENKLLKELSPGAKTIVNIFPFPNWKSDRQESGVSLYCR